MADGEADEEKLLEDAIAVLDCLLEEVGGAYGAVDQHASACQACKGIYSSDLPCKGCDIHHSRHQHLHHDRQPKQPLYPRPQAWGQPWPQQAEQQPWMPAQQREQQHHEWVQQPQTVQQPWSQLQLQSQLQQQQLQRAMPQTPLQSQDRGEVCALARIDIGMGTVAGGRRSEHADVLMYANGLFNASQACMASDEHSRMDSDPKPQAPQSPPWPPQQQQQRTLSSQQRSAHGGQEPLLPLPPPCPTELPLEIQPVYDHEQGLAIGTRVQPPQQPKPLPCGTDSTKVQESQRQSKQGEALQQPQPQPRLHPLAGLHNQLLTTKCQSHSQPEFCIDPRGRTACRLANGHHPQPRSAPAEANVAASAEASVPADEGSTDTGGGDAGGGHDSREAREKKQHHIHHYHGGGGDPGGTVGCPGRGQGTPMTGDGAAAATAADMAASAPPFRPLSLNRTTSGNCSSQGQGAHGNQGIHDHSGDLLRRTLEQAGVAAATAAAGQGPAAPAGVASSGSGTTAMVAKVRQLLPPPPPATSSAGRGGGRRRSVMYGVTPEQEERLAKAMEKARRLSVDAVEGRSDGADGGGSEVRSSCAGSERHTLHSLASHNGRSLSRPSATTAAAAAAAVVAANTELLNDMVDEMLANKPEGMSNRSVRNAATGGPPTALRRMETRAGGIGVGVEKLLLSSGGALGGGQGLTLWAGNKSKVEHARLAVRLLQATDLSRSREDKQIDPYAVVSCEDKSYTSKAVMKSKDPFWDEFFVFDVRNAAFAELKIKVFDHLRCWRPALLGRICIAVKSIADSPSRYSQPSWHQLRLKTKMKGQVLMQIFYTAEWVHRPLKVLAGTWNVGNAEPPPDLGPWLQGVQALQHDLVAIGVQECFYKVGAGPLEPDAQVVDDEDAYLVEEMGFDDEMISAFGTTQYRLRDNNDGSSRPNGHSNACARGQVNASLDGEDNMLDSLAHGNILTGCAAPAGPRAARPAAGTHSGLSVVIANGGAGGASASPSTAGTGGGGGNITPDCGGGGGVADGGGASSSAVTRESSVTHVGGGAGTTGDIMSPPDSFTHQRGARSRSKSVLMPSGALPPPHLAMMMQAAVASKDGMNSHSGSNGASLPSPPPLPPHPRPPGAASRRRHSTLEPPPRLNRVATMAARVGSVPVVPGGGLLPFDGSFTSAGVAGSGASGVGFRRPSLGASGASGPGSRSSAQQQQQAKTCQQTYKSKGVLGDMAKVGSEFKELWEERLKEAVGPGYFLVASSHMGQIRLLLFARNDVYAAISDVRTGKQATGVAGVATNKGGVGISLRVWNTTIAFVNSHLAAHQDRTRARNNNYRDIIRGLKLDPQGFHMDVLTAFHHVVWMGDLNYRLDYGQQAITPTESPTPADFASLVGEVQKGAFRKLIEVDQLKREMQAKRAFLGFNEGAINFEPTFKVRRRRGLDYNPQRSPAYCDRILFRSNLPLKQIRVLSYFSPSEVATSDHKPVGAVLLVPTVWRVTVEESDRGRAPQQSQPGHSGNLLGSDGGTGSSGLGHLHLPRSFHHTASQLQQQGPVVRLTFLTLHAHGLFMLRSRRRSSMNPATEFPCPQVLFSAPCMREATVRSRVASMTRDPTWANADDESLGPLVIDLKTSSMAEMAHFRLWIRVLDQREKGARLGGGGAAGAGGSAIALGSGAKSTLTGFGAGGGGGGGGGPGGNVLARGVLPLLDAVTMLLQDPQGVASFKVQLELHGLPAGILDGSMRLEVVERFKALERRNFPERPQHKPSRPAPSRGSSFGTSSSPLHGNSGTGPGGGQCGSGAPASNCGPRHRFSGGGSTPIEEDQEAKRRSSGGFGTADGDGAGGAAGGSSGAGGGGRASFFATLRRSLGAAGVPRDGSQPPTDQAL